MKPENVKERRTSFIKFLLLFVLTTTMIMVAVFFNFKVPQKETALLKERSVYMEREMTYQKGFAQKVHDVQAMIDSLDAPGQNIAFTNSLIHSQLADLQHTIPREDSTYRFDMYSDIIETLVDLQTTKNELNKLQGAKMQITEYQEVLKQTRNELEQTKRDLDILRISRN